MAIVHNTTMSPAKLELLAAWLPAQPWFPGSGREPELAKVGGFRLDDPQGDRPQFCSSRREGPSA